MNFLVETLNQWGGSFPGFAWPMFWQSSLLIAAVVALDFLFRRQLRASLRYALWLVVLVKLCVPPTFALPTSPAWWLHQTAATTAAQPKAPHYTVTYDQRPLPELSPKPLTNFTLSQPAMTNGAWLLVFSVLISGALLFWMLARWWQIVRLVRRATISGRLTALAGEVQRCAGMKGHVRVKLTPHSMSPAVCGLFRPAILIPQSLAEQFSDEQLRAVLLHELIHLRRRDVWLNFMQALLQIGYWWHPLVWLANARIRRVREEAVDDAVMLTLRDESETYAPTLLEVAKLALNRPSVTLGLVGILESRSALRQRIERLVDFRPPRQAGLTLASLLGILAFTAVAVPMGQGPKPADQLGKDKEVKINVPWPDPKYEGCRDINLMVQFLIIDESAFRLINILQSDTTKPTLHTSDETDAILSLLKSNGAKTFNDYGGGIRQPAISGVFQKYQIGGGTNRFGSVTALATNLGGNYSNIISGFEIFMPATQPEWTPMNFDLRALAEDDGIRCKIGSSFLGIVDSRQQFEVKIPNGSAMIWVKKSPTMPWKCQIILLMTWGQSDNYQSVPFLKRTLQASQTALYSARSEQGEKIDEEISATLIFDRLIHNAGMNFLPPRYFCFTTNRQLEVYAPKRDLDQIENLLHRVNAQDANRVGLIESTGQTETNLIRRTFKVDTNSFANVLREQTGLKTNSVQVMAERVFNKLGVDLESSNGKSVFYNDRLGLLFVRATASDVDTIKTAIPALNNMPTEIHIKARFVEVPQRALTPFDNWNMPSQTNGSPDKLVGILDNENVKVALRALQKQAGFEDLAEPEATSISDREIQMRATETTNVVTDFILQETSTNSAISPQVEKVETGPVIDVVPVVSGDGGKIDLKITATVTEFLGYDQTTNTTVVHDKTGAEVDLPQALPRFRIREAHAHVNIFDGQTVILGTFQNRVLAHGQETIKKTSGADKELLIFVTATLITPDGRRIHTGDALPFAIPSQPVAE